jgi:type II secretory pathway predicted ATPase ExeA
MFAQIQAAVLTLYKNQKMTPVFVLDEMHLASNAFLDDISLLFNFYMDSENPYILCLIGLPHLIDRLRLMQFQPLEQRIVIRHRHRALLPEEAAPYIEHHLKLAGASATIFKPSAIEAIAAKVTGEQSSKFEKNFGETNRIREGAVDATPKSTLKSKEKKLPGSTT